MNTKIFFVSAAALLAGFFVLIARKCVSTLVFFAAGLKNKKIILAIISAISFAYALGWEFSIVIMIFLLVHECGHLWAMERCGMKTDGIYFIPFLGGAVVSNDKFPSRRAEAFIAIMGPAWGFALAALTSVAYAATMNPVFSGAAILMIVLNLFNLIPIDPLDGGRILKSIAYSISAKAGFLFLLSGIIISGYLALCAGLTVFAALVIINIFNLLNDYMHKKHIHYPRMSAFAIVESVVIYCLTTSISLLAMTYLLNAPDIVTAVSRLFFKG